MPELVGPGNSILSVRVDVAAGNVTMYATQSDQTLAYTLAAAKYTNPDILDDLITELQYAQKLIGERGDTNGST
jgi:2',3'-cyclic-nucleotide 2'-phosphodiesterase (5'-nucleotidase family)